MYRIPEIDPPVGLRAMVTAVDEICKSAAMYRHGNATPGHFLVTLDAGNGRTTLVQHMADMFAAHRIRHFGGLDPFLEFTVAGTTVQLKQILGTIRNCAVYTNHYNGIIAMDIAALAGHMGEPIFQYFLTEIAEVAAEATIIFFLPGTLNRNQELLAEKLCAALDDELQFIRLGDYTDEELAQIVELTMENGGIEIREPEQFHEALVGEINACGIRTAGEAVKMAGKIMRKADYSRFHVTIEVEQLKAATAYIVRG